MIISASRRTDIPAFYAPWFMNRIRAGFCTVPNPFNARQISRVSLCPEDVDGITFWTRSPLPLLPHLPELAERGFGVSFLVTVMANPRPIDPGAPPVETALESFRRLACVAGPERVTWRYDPILFTTVTDAAFHAKAFDRIARELKGFTERCIISFVHPYAKVKRRLAALEKQNIGLLKADTAVLGSLLPALAQSALENGMEITSCAGQHDFRPYGIAPGRCIDGKRLSGLWETPLPRGEDPSQRTTCGCTASKDIGMYDSCLFGCVYCYATTHLTRARTNHARHDPRSPSLLGWHEPGTPIQQK